MKGRAEAKNLFAPFPLVEENRVNSRDEFIDIFIFPGKTSDETLVIKSLLDKTIWKINSEILTETCLNMGLSSYRSALSFIPRMT